MTDLPSLPARLEYARGYAAGYQTALAAALDVAHKLGGDRVESERPKHSGSRLDAVIHAQHVRAASIAKAIADLAALEPGVAEINAARDAGLKAASRSNG